MKHTISGQLLTELILEIFKLNGMLTLEGDQLTKEHNLSSAQWKVLGALAMSSDPMTVSHIARTMGQSRQGVQRLVNKMSKEGLLASQPNPLHKRAKLITLTTAGRDVYGKVSKKQIPWANNIAENMESSNLQATLSVVKALRAKMENV